MHVFLIVVGAWILVLAALWYLVRQGHGTDVARKRESDDHWLSRRAERECHSLDKRLTAVEAALDELIEHFRVRRMGERHTHPPDMGEDT